jgi:hypothetical protein
MNCPYSIGENHNAMQMIWHHGPFIRHNFSRRIQPHIPVGNYRNCAGGLYDMTND